MSESAGEEQVKMMKRNTASSSVKPLAFVGLNEPDTFTRALFATTVQQNRQEYKAVNKVVVMNPKSYTEKLYKTFLTPHIK
jgi:hypothetical protein